MMIKHLFFGNESYSNWDYRKINSGFSRLYYVLDGEAHYEENGRVVRLKRNHLYLTPVKKHFSLYDNPDDRLLHTYAHVTTLPAVTELTEIEVVEGTPLYDGVMLWRKYAACRDYALLADVVGFVLSRIEPVGLPRESLAEQAKAYLDTLEDGMPDMAEMSRALGYSREHVTRSFAAAYRVTPTQYLNLRRMKLALERLSEGAKVSEVSDQLGYASPYAFSKAFKKHFGASPVQYLASLRRDSEKKTSKKDE